MRDELENIQKAFDLYSEQYIENGKTFKIGWSGILVLHGIWRTLILILKNLEKK